MAGLLLPKMLRSAAGKAVSDMALIAEDPEARRKIQELTNAVIALAQTMSTDAEVLDCIIEGLPDVTKNAALQARVERLETALRWIAAAEDMTFFMGGPEIREKARAALEEGKAQ